MLKVMKQYHFERDDFCNVFNEVFSMEEYDKLLDLLTLGYKTFRFILMRNNDDFYILDTSNGLLIGWYKHLGRINVTNDENLTLEELKSELFELREDILNNG